MIELNTKRTETEVNYTFGDGSTAMLTIRSASTKEIDSTVADKNTENGMTVNEKMVRLFLCKNDQSVVDKVYKEVYEEGHVGDFVNLLIQIIGKEKQGKWNDLLNG